jgi:hypothetical protein
MTKITMNKKIIIIAVVILILLVIVFLIVKNNTQRSSDPEKNITAKEEINDIPITDSAKEISEKETQKEKDKKITITSTNPKDEETNVKADLEQLIIEFNRQIDIKNLEFAIAPQVKFNPQSIRNKLIINFSEPLQKGQTYSWTLISENIDPPDQTFYFVVKGPTPTPKPNTHSEGILQGAEKESFEKHPDLYLYGKSPHSTNSFEIKADLTDEGNVEFTVTLKTENMDKARKEFISWLIEDLKLTEEQITEFDINYETETGGNVATPSSFDQLKEVLNTPREYKEITVQYTQSIDTFTVYYSEMEKEEAKDVFKDLLANYDVSNISSLKIDYEDLSRPPLGRPDGYEE